MPMITIQYDDGKVSDDEISELATEIQKIVSKITKIEDVFVYGNSAKVKVKIAPIEIFVKMSDFKIKDLDALTAQIKAELIDWKNKTGFRRPINLTVIPMHWKVEVEI